MFQVEVLWVMTPGSVVVRYYLEVGVNVNLCDVGILNNTTRLHNPENLDLKRKYR
jgi:hypothetical protein